MSLSPDGDLWNINKFQPFSNDNQKKKIYGGTQAADTISIYVMDAVRLSNRDLKGRWVSDFRAKGLLLRMAEQKQVWPVNVQIDQKPYKVDEILGKMFDYKIVGSVIIYESGSEISAKELELQELGGNWYVITRIIADRWKDDRLTIGKRIFISPDGSYLDQEGGQRIGAVYNIGNVINFMSGWRDRAMEVSDKVLTSTGGIDLRPARMDLQTRMDSSPGEIKFHLDSAMLAQLQNAPGFVPVIVDVQPLKSLSDFLEI